MAIPYKSIPRKNPQNQAAPPLHYPTVVLDGEITLRQIIEEFADKSSISTADSLASAELVMKGLIKHLGMGISVKLGFGSFRPTIDGIGELTPQAVNRKSIKKVRVVFNPSVEMEKGMDGFEFRKVTDTP